jgi:anaerobic C4-dicarboxylate transporter DcuB
MDMLLGFIIIIGCLIIGVRHGGLGLAVISGIGLVILVFIFGLKPGSPPVGVMLTIMAVVTCSGFLQASRGLDVMLKYAEKFLRRNPKYVTVLAPITTWFLTVLCGTGHVVYTMFPIIYDIAIKQNIRPERPMAVASVASQMGICASPASVAVVSMVAMLANTSAPVGVIQILAISMPATLCGVIVAGLWSLRRGKDLDKDEDFQQRLADPEQKAYIYGETGDNTGSSLANMELPKSAYWATAIFIIGIIIIAIFGSFPQFLPHFADAKGVLKPLSMTLAIQMLMLVVAAIIMLVCHVKVSDVTNGSVFKAGMVAVISVYGVAWMAETYFGAYLPILKESLGQVVLDYPWTYAIVLFLISKLVNSQAAALAIVVPMALGVGVDPLIILSFISACYGYFFLPTYPSDLACIGFDRSGTTRIGKFVINHSFIIPGFIGIGTGCCVGYVLAHMFI